MITTPAERIARRTVLSGAAVAGMALAAACSTPGTPETERQAMPRNTSPEGGRVLLAFFSRPGWNYNNGGRIHLDVGNTEVLARMISAAIGCDVYRIEAADQYPDDYDATVARNVREEQTDARPSIAKPLDSMDGYDRVILASPIWNSRAPMIMSTFAEGHDFSGRTVYPVTTYAMSGLGTTARDYRVSCRGATIGEGFAVRGEEVADARAATVEWLRRVRLI